MLERERESYVTVLINVWIASSTSSFLCMFAYLLTCSMSSFDFGFWGFTVYTMQFLLSQTTFTSYFSSLDYSVMLCSLVMKRFIKCPPFFLCKKWFCFLFFIISKWIALSVKIWCPVFLCWSIYCFWLHKSLDFLVYLLSSTNEGKLVLLLF